MQFRLRNGTQLYRPTYQSLRVVNICTLFQFKKKRCQVLLFKHVNLTLSLHHCQWLKKLNGSDIQLVNPTKLTKLVRIKLRLYDTCFNLYIVNQMFFFGGNPFLLVLLSPPSQKFSVHKNSLLHRICLHLLKLSSTETVSHH